jgi:hypothetical protein
MTSLKTFNFDFDSASNLMTVHQSFIEGSTNVLKRFHCSCKAFDNDNNELFVSEGYVSINPTEGTTIGDEGLFSVDSGELTIAGQYLFDQKVNYDNINMPLPQSGVDIEGQMPLVSGATQYYFVVSMDVEVTTL